MTTQQTEPYDYDVIIIGGGPSGSIAAYNACKGGLRVLIVEKTVFPRVKPCAGGLTGRALNWLPFSVGDVIESTTTEMHIGYKYSKTRALKAPGTVCAMVVRDKFDNFLLNKAMDVGAEVSFEFKLKSITETDNAVEVGFKCGKCLRAKYLVGADGVNSMTRRLINDGAWLHRGFALEGLVPKSEVSGTFPMQFDFGIAEGGYGWIFPKKDHYNVGIGILSQEHSFSREELNIYAKNRLGVDGLQDVVGFSIGFGGEHYRPKNKRVILVGDAAGFAECFLAEGLHNAIKSGNIAGKILVKAAKKGSRNIANIYYRKLTGLRWDLKLLRYVAQKRVYPKLAELGERIIRSAENPPTNTKSRSLSGPFMRGTVVGKSFIEIVLKFPFSRFWTITESQSVKDYQRRLQGTIKD